MRPPFAAGAFISTARCGRATPFAWASPSAAGVHLPRVLAPYGCPRQPRGSPFTAPSVVASAAWIRPP
eukprot:7444038-Alexandrium_andersonii.AAC.1